MRSRTDGPFGVGFITHLIGADPTNFEIALEEKVPVIIFSFADPEPWLGRAKDAGALTIARCRLRSWRKWPSTPARTCCWPRATRPVATPAR